MYVPGPNLNQFHSRLIHPALPLHRVPAGEADTAAAAAAAATAAAATAIAAAAETSKQYTGTAM